MGEHGENASSKVKTTTTNGSSTVQITKAIRIAFQCQHDEVEKYTEKLMEKLLKIKKFQKVLYEKNVEVVDHNKANVEFIMFRSKEKEPKYAPIAKMMQILTVERMKKRIKNVKTEVIPYFVE